MLVGIGNDAYIDSKTFWCFALIFLEILKLILVKEEKEKYVLIIRKNDY